MEALDELASALRSRLIERARDGAAGGGLEDEVRALVEDQAGPLPEAERDALAERVVLLASGLGPLEPLLADPGVDEVMVNGAGSVYVERAGRIERTGVRFRDEAELMHAVERILAPLGRRVDEASPLCDARLPDGSRVNVVIPPLSLDGPCLTIRRFRRRGFSLRDLVTNATLPPALAEFLALCVAARATILVSGGTGSGKTTTLNALCGAIPGEERIVTIEDAAELRLRQRHVVRLEARPPNLEGRGEVTIRQLVRNALRMRPDRIVVGEVRGGEALDMLQALNTGHDGSLTHGARQLARGRAAPRGDAGADGRGGAAARGGEGAGGECRGRCRPPGAPGRRVAGGGVGHRSRSRSRRRGCSRDIPPGRAPAGAAGGPLAARLERIRGS